MRKRGIMSSSQDDKYQKLLMNYKNQILNQAPMAQNEFQFQSEDLSDEADYANSMINQQMAFSLKERDMAKLRLIDKAMIKIEKGGFGECEECGEAISEKRLAKQPWAELCLEHAEELEREHAHHYPKSKAPKSHTF
jgi:DnaK suppressor protein